MIEKIKVIKSWIDLAKKVQTHDNRLENLGINPESWIRDNFSFEEYTKLVKEVVEDKDNWLEWFLYEADLGDKNMEVIYQGEARMIKTAEDLLWAMK